jgi:hypothetical protein
MLTDKPILFEAKDETNYYTWRIGYVEWESETGTLTITTVQRHNLAISLEADEVTGFEIVQREGISTLPHVALGALLADWNTGLGCLLSLILAPIALVDWIAAKRTRFPVIRLVQSNGDGAEQGWTLDLRSRKRGRRGREETRALANRLADVLHNTGYGGSMPDFSSDALWFNTR